MTQKTFLLALLIFLSNGAFSQDSTQTVMVRAVESWFTPMGQSYPSRILISYPDGRGKEVALYNKASKKFAENTRIIHDTLNEFFSDDYELVSEMCGAGDAATYYLWVFKVISKEE